MPDPTRVHAYLARIKDQEREVIAVPDGVGRALCISLDKHWTFTREWDELHIIAPLVEDEGNDDELERDEWKERAESAEQKYGTERLRWERAREHHADESRKWGEKRRAYEAQIAELEVDAADGDPIVYAVRESDVAAVKIELDSYGEPFADGEHVYTDSAADARNLAGGHIQKAIRRFAVARAIEQAEDPIEEKARELYRAATPDARWETVADEYRRIAAHVLRQEASSDEDKGAISNPTPNEADTNA